MKTPFIIAVLIASILLTLTVKLIHRPSTENHQSKKERFAESDRHQGKTHVANSRQNQLLTVERILELMELDLGADGFDEVLKEILTSRLMPPNKYSNEAIPIDMKTGFDLLDRFGGKRAKGFIVASWISELRDPDQVLAFYNDGVNKLKDTALRRSVLTRISQIHFQDTDNLRSGFDSEFISTVLNDYPDDAGSLDIGIVQAVMRRIRENPEQKDVILEIVDGLDLPVQTRQMINIVAGQIN